MFAGLSRRLLARLAVQLFEKAYAPGETVFREGDPGKGLFIVLDGEVEIIRETAQGDQRLATYAPGTAFGELALIDDLPRSATARTSTPSRLLILYRSHFETLIAGDKATALVVMHNLLRTLAGYVRQRNYGRDFLDFYLVPMSSAVWSTPPELMLEFPAVTLLRFFHNHGFLGLHTPRPWLTIAGGAKTYVEKITAPFREPRHGGRGMAEYARWAFEGEQSVECWFGEPIVSGDQAAVEWRAVGVIAGKPYTLAGFSKLRFGPDGRVVDHREYWHETESHEPAPPGWGT